MFQGIIEEADDTAQELLTAGIRRTELDEIRIELQSEGSTIFVRGLSVEERAIAHPAIGELVADQLETNEFQDDAKTEEARQAAADAVGDVLFTYLAGSEIADVGDLLTPVMVEAINELDLVTKEPGVSRQAIVVLGALTVSLAAFFLWRLAPGQWSDPKHFALLGILLVLAALSSRIPELADGGDATSLHSVLPFRPCCSDTSPRFCTTRERPSCWLSR